MSKYTPHTSLEKEEMLNSIGVKNLNDLYCDVPTDLMLKKLNLPQGLSQLEVEKELNSLANKNKQYSLILRGAGAYDHYIPAPVRTLSIREEFVTAYTPYQAEISQGILQAIFEYQTEMCELTGMDVSNASVYDGASSAAEAVKMCCDNRNTVLVSNLINPDYLEVIKTYAFGANINIMLIENKNGIIDCDDLKAKLNDDVACLVVSNPNYFGHLEDMTMLAELAHGCGAKFIYAFNPICAAVLKTPFDCGSDIAVGEGQPLGLALSFGGAYLGILTCTKQFLRKIPGRIVGETVDKDGKRAFVLTLQAREQHIRREKATSSLCSNEALCALTASIYLASVGKSGLIETANQCLSKAHYFAKELSKINGISLVNQSEFFHEFLTEIQNRDKVLKKLDKNNILGGLPVGKNNILWCVTEKATKDDLDKVVSLVKEVCK